MSTLQRTLSRRFKLIYIDVPRIEGYDENRAFTTSGPTWGTWLAVIQSHLQAATRLMARDGVLVMHGGPREQAYATVLGYERFGPGNHLGTIVWQSHYSAKGGKAGSEIANTHETLICFADEIEAVGPVALSQPAAGYANPDGDPRGDWKAPQKDAGRDTVKLVYNLPPYRWKLTAGDLPPGIWRISPFSGVIWGQPSKKGTWKFTVEVSDSEGRVAAKNLSLTITEEGDTPKPSHDIWWMENPPTAKAGKPRIRTSKLPNGIVGEPYTVILEASGGSPVLGQKRPSRGWGFGKKTLVSAIREDRCYFGRKGNAIPEPKRYLSALAQGTTQVNVTSWWPGSEVGWSQDATKHLKKLNEAGIVDEVGETAKPERLMARLIDAFTKPDDLVLEMFARTGDLSSVAMKMGRPFVALTGVGELDDQTMKGCFRPRIEAICSGTEQIALGESEDSVAASPSSMRGFTVARQKPPLASTDAKRDEFPRLLRGNYEDPGTLATAVLTSQGYIPIDRTDEFVFGTSVAYGGAGIALRPSVFLDQVRAAELLNLRRPSHLHLTIFYFRSSEDFDPRGFSAAASFRRVPMELAL